MEKQSTAQPRPAGGCGSRAAAHQNVRDVDVLPAPSPDHLVEELASGADERLRADPLARPVSRRTSAKRLRRRRRARCSPRRAACSVHSPSLADLRGCAAQAGRRRFPSSIAGKTAADGPPAQPTPSPAWRASWPGTAASSPQLRRPARYPTWRVPRPSDTRAIHEDGAGYLPIAVVVTCRCRRSPRFRIAT